MLYFYSSHLFLSVLPVSTFGDCREKNKKVQMSKIHDDFAESAETAVTLSKQLGLLGWGGCPDCATVRKHSAW